MQICFTSRNLCCYNNLDKFLIDLWKQRNNYLQLNLYIVSVICKNYLGLVLELKEVRNLIFEPLINIISPFMTS